jgi:gag-polyprotein putative aspartyl protease
MTIRLIAALAVCVLLAAPSAGSAQTSPAALPPLHHDSTPPKRIAMPRVVDVPLLRTSERNRSPQIDVMVNGQGPFRFLVETGAREINLSPALIAKLALKRTRGSGDDTQYRLERITIGDASFERMTVETMPGAITGVDGVLGLPFFQNVLLTIDYPAERLRMVLGKLPAANGRDILPLIRISDYWGLHIVLGGKPFDAVLDTQNSAALGAPPSVGDQLEFDGGVRTVGRARGVFGVTDVKAGVVKGDLVIGRYTITNPTLNVLELPPEYPRAVNIGSGLLSQFVVTIDQRKGRIRLEEP